MKAHLLNTTPLQTTMPTVVWLGALRGAPSRRGPTPAKPGGDSGHPPRPGFEGPRGKGAHRPDAPPAVHGTKPAALARRTDLSGPTGVGGKPPPGLGGEDANSIPASR